MNDHEVLRRAAHDMVLDSLVAPDLEQASDVKMAMLYDELMAIPSEAQVKEAAAKAASDDPVVKDAERIMRAEYLGKIGARAYVESMRDQLPKLAQGIEGIKTKIMGTTPEERMRREKTKREQSLGIDRMRREHELSLRPREVSLDLGTRGATGNLGTEQSFQSLGVQEATQRQELANQLRKLQLGDQYARRDREQQLFDSLHAEKRVAGPVTHAVAGGALGHLMAGAGRSALSGLSGAARAAENPRAAEAISKLKIPGIRGGAAAGLGVYLARKLLTNPNPASREVTRLERERFIPGSMQADVAM